MSAKFPNTYLGYQYAFSTENRVSGLKRPRFVQLVCKVLRCPPRSDNRRLHALLSFKEREKETHYVQGCGAVLARWFLCEGKEPQSLHTTLLPQERKVPESVIVVCREKERLYPYGTVILLLHVSSHGCLLQYHTGC